MGTYPILLTTEAVEENTDKSNCLKNRRMCDNTARSHRKTSKPMMEKRRRARINQSLAELKELIVCCDKYELENCRRTNRAKLEKADILELTVRHLHRLHDDKNESDKPEDTAKGHHQHVMEKFRDGFHECVQEIERYLSHNNVTLDKPSQGRLFEHLKTRLQDLNPEHTCTDHSDPKTNKDRVQPPSGAEVKRNSQSGQIEQPVKNIIQVKVRARANVQRLIRIRPEAVRVDVWRPW